MYLFSFSSAFWVGFCWSAAFTACCGGKGRRKLDYWWRHRIIMGSRVARRSNNSMPKSVRLRSRHHLINKCEAKKSTVRSRVGNLGQFWPSFTVCRWQWPSEKIFPDNSGLNPFLTRIKRQLLLNKCSGAAAVSPPRLSLYYDKESTSKMACSFSANKNKN